MLLPMPAHLFWHPPLSLELSMRRELLRAQGLIHRVRNPPGTSQMADKRGIPDNDRHPRPPIVSVNPIPVWL